MDDIYNIENWLAMFYSHENRGIGKSYSALHLADRAKGIFVSYNKLMDDNHKTEAKRHNLENIKRFYSVQEKAPLGLHVPVVFDPDCLVRIIDKYVYKIRDLTRDNEKANSRIEELIFKIDLLKKENNDLKKELLERKKGHKWKRILHILKKLLKR